MKREKYKGTRGRQKRGATQARKRKPQKEHSVAPKESPKLIEFHQDLATEQATTPPKLTLYKAVAQQ